VPGDKPRLLIVVLSHVAVPVRVVPDK
jgi:hypothetical protein